MQVPRKGSRCRCRLGPNDFEVSARIERFIEPTLLLLLSEGSSHGYELAEQVGSLIGEAGVDLGNLYRLLRALEAEGLVRSTWRNDLPGPLKRTYELTDEGWALLKAWVDSLQGIQLRLNTFFQRFASTTKIPTKNKESKL